MKDLNEFETVLFKKIIDSYISTKLVEHHLESYNNLINFGFQRIFDNVPPIIINHKEDETYVVRFGQVYIDSPFIIEEDRKINYITPNEARLRDLYYESNLYVDIQEEFFKEDKLIVTKFLQKVYIASIPTMINSCKCNLFDKTKDEKIDLGECENDPGGYFIVKGKERVLIGQERINYNQLYVFKQKEAKPIKVQSKSKVIKPVYIGEIRSMSEETGHSVLIQCKITKEARIYFSIPYVKQEIPAGILFKAYGCNDYKKLIIDPKIEGIFSFVLFNIEKEALEINTQEEALDYIGNFSITPISKERKVAYAQQILDSELFPHLGSSSTFEKVCILGNMINKVVLTFLKLRGEDDRYNISMKRVEMPGLLIGDLFRMLLKRTIENIKKYLLKRQDIMTVLAKNTAITNAIRMNFATGAWGIQKNNYIRNGVSQVLSRLTYSSMLSHLRRVVVPIGREGKNTKIRQLHPTQVFFICPAESPESSCVGIVKNLAMLSRISIGVSTVIMKEILNKCKNIIILNDNTIINSEIHSFTKVMLNGSWFGITKNKDLVFDEIYYLRKTGLLHHEVSFSYDEDDNEIKIFSDEGRFMRALFTMKNNKIFDFKIIENIPTTEVWNYLVENDHVRYVDANEVENSLISMFPEVEDPEENYNYCEIHPSMMLGVCASSIPYSANSQSPRNCYQCIEENEPVLMGDGTKKKIKDVRVGDTVITVNPVTYEKSVTKVINQYVKPTLKHIVKVITIRCRQIVTTEDHLFLTDKGWKRAQDLIVNLDKVCINTKDNITFEEVISVNRVPNVTIADITTESENHSFIAGDGFVVHNSSMFKQAIGTFALSYQLRVDTVAHVLMYPQKRLVSTTPSKLLKYNDMPAGINAVVAVACYSGLNQEDSIIVNKGSVDRGLFHSTVYKTISCEERKKSLNNEIIEIPPSEIRNKSYNYLKLDQNGIIKEGAYVNKNDVLIGKTLTKTNKQDGIETRIECSLIAKQSEEGIVDKIFHLTSQDGYRLIKIRIRQLRIPEIGDKLASTAAQKSTIGAIFNQEDMPFTRDGITPDLIINPMCLPGRMTINQLIECVIGKACSVAGKLADATPFTSVTNDPIKQVKTELDKYGFNNLGNEVMMNGMTGEMLDAEIYIGPTYYQRLKHLVKDKLHSRARGSVQLLTNQPNSGRASEGGLNLWSSWKKFIMTKIQLVLCEGQHT